VLALIAADRTDSTPRALHERFRGRRGFGAWLDAMDRHPKSVNVGSYLGATTVRAYAMGRRAGAPNAAELDTMRRVAADAVRDGAVGLATALIYPPGSYATTGELTAMVGAMRGRGAYITHMRSEGGRLLEAADEAMAIARGGGAPLIIYHLKATGRCNWPKARALVAKIDSARAAGMDVTATMYPYAASGNNLAGGIVPDWAEENGRLLDNLRDSTARRRMLAEMTGQVAAASSEATAGAASAECLTDPAAVMVLGFRDSSLVKYNGRRLDAIARDRRQGWAEAMLDLLLAERGALSKLTVRHERGEHRPPAAAAVGGDRQRRRRPGPGAGARAHAPAGVRHLRPRARQVRAPGLRAGARGRGAPHDGRDRPVARAARPRAPARGDARRRRAVRPRRGRRRRDVRPAAPALARRVARVGERRRRVAGRRAHGRDARARGARRGLRAASLTGRRGPGGDTNGGGRAADAGRIRSIKI
jgi:hypothetical protein